MKRFSAQPPSNKRSNRLISVERNDRVVIVTFNNPPVNALSLGLVEELEAVVIAIGRDPNIRVVLFRGQGKHFCAGADLRERQGMSEREVLRFVQKLSRLFTRVARLPIPTVAVVHGACVGGGLELALACDFRLMATDSFVGLPEVSLGIIPGAGGTQRLPRLIGPARAADWILTGRKITSAEAVQAGLASRVVAPSRLSREANKLAEALARNAPLAIRSAKQALRKGWGEKERAGLAVEQEQYRSVLMSRDRLEGIRAFLEKRKAVWKGH